MDDLPLQVRVIDDVEVDHAKRAHASRRQIERQRRTQPTGADAQHLRGLDLLLPLHAHFGHDQMSRVAQDLIFVQRHWNFCNRSSHISSN